MIFGEIITAMITPFTKNGEKINLDESTRIGQHLVDTGTDTLLLVGTTGESPTLTHDEEYEFFQHMISEFRGKAKIMAGTGSNCTRTAIESTIKASDLGVDGVLQVVPYYNKPSQEGIYQHFNTVSKNTDTPILLYNIPGRTGINMEPETVLKLSELDNVIGIKEASGSIDQVKSISALCPQNFSIYSGDDALTIEFMKSGAVGVVSVASHVAGIHLRRMINLFNSNDIASADLLCNQLMPLFDALFITSNPSPVKACLDNIGFLTGGVRLPLVPVTDEQNLQIMKAYETIQSLSG